MKSTSSPKMRKREQSLKRRGSSDLAYRSKLAYRPMLEPLEDRVLLTASPFIGGDVVVARIGDGTQALTNIGNPYFLDEYSPSGALVQSVALPTTGSAPNNPIVNTGTGQVNGELALSADGRYVTFTGYDFNLPNLTNINLKASSSPRDMGRIDINANLDTSTDLTDYSGGTTPGAAMSSDGTSFYVDTTSGGIRIATLGSTTSSQVVNPADPHFGGGSFNFMQIYNNQLYVTDRTALYKVGTGVPGAGSAALTPLPGLSLAGFSGDGGIDFFFATLDPADHGTQPDTLYIAQKSGSNSGEIAKFSATFSGGLPTNWSPSGFVLAASAGGLTGYANGSSVVMYATAGSLNAAGGGTSSGGGALYSYTDTTGYNVAIPGGAIATTLVSGLPGNEGFRGIAFVPNQAPVLNQTGTSSFPDILENASSVSNAGELVSGLISGLGANPISDTNGSQHQGIAITAADQSNGTWQSSIDGGATWVNFPAVSNSNAVTLASDGATKVRFSPALDYHGGATFTFRAWDQSQGTNGGTFNITMTGGGSAFSTATAMASQNVLYVNQTPSFVRGLDQAILNTAGAQSVSNWATAISPGAPNESGQALNFIVSNNNNSLFLVQPSISPTGTLTYTPNPVQTGSATVMVQIHDDGGTANGAIDTSATQTFQITLTPVGGNQPPVNSIPFAAQTTLENQSLTFSVANSNAISVSDADAGSNPIQVALTVTGGIATLSGLTGLSGSGNGTSSLTYTGTITDLNTALAGLVYAPTANINGAAAGQIMIATDDLGHTGTGGPNTSTNTITINITPVNQAPSYTPGGNIMIPASGNPYSAQWATNVSPGPPNESSQTVAFLVSNNAPGLFTVQPSISPTGVLTFTPVHGPAGTATVTVQLKDNGGTANGGVDRTTPQTFLIQLTAVDLPPVNTVPPTQRDLENTPLQFLPAGFNAISVDDPDSNGSTEQLTLSSTNGTVTLADTSSVTIVSSTPVRGVHSPGPYTSVTVRGLLTNFTNDALYYPIYGTGLTFTPTTGFTGTAVLTVSTDDLSNVSPGPLTTANTININVVTPPPLVISEVLSNPPGTDEPNDFIEVHSATPNYTIPNGTYFVSLSGSSQTLQVGNTLTTYPTGTVFDTFDLSGRVTGSDGYLVILQNGNTYNDYPAYGGLNLIDPRATVLDNGVNPDGSIAVGTGAGFGNNLASPGSSIVGHSALFRPFDTNMLKGSATYLLVNTPNALNPGDLLDAPTTMGGPPTGTLHGTEYNGWNVYDSIGTTVSTVGTFGDVSYGFINYPTSAGTNYATPNSTIVPVTFGVDYFGRYNNVNNPNPDDLGSIATDWIAGATLGGTVPTWGLGGSSKTAPSLYSPDGLNIYSNAKRPLNTIGGPHFDSATPAVVATTGGTLSYPVGSGNVVIDPSVAVSDPHSFFLGSAQVQITGNFDPTTDSLAFPGALRITGTYSASTGLLTLQGFDTFANWNAALQSVTYNYRAGSVDMAHPTRTITFEANDAALLSNQATRTIMLTGPVVSPPVVTGTSGSPVTWTEALPPAAPPQTVIASGLAVTDAGAMNLTAATVAISAGFLSSEDVLGWSSATATANHIAVSYTPGTNKLTLAPAMPDASEPLAKFQAVLQTVTYSNSSQNPTAASRTATFTVVDTNSITSTVTSSSQQVINVVPVNNPPTITSGGSTAYTAGHPAVLVDGALTVTDPDSPTLVGATVSITGGFAAGDTLGFVNQDGVSGSYNAGTGVLTLTGGSTPLDYQFALRAVTFSNAFSAPGGARTISFQADDGANQGTPDGNVATKQVNVTAQAPPVIHPSGTTPFTYTNTWSAIGTPASVVDPGPGATGATITDADDTNLASLTVSIASPAAHDVLTATGQGNVTVSGNGTNTLTFTPTSGTATLADFQATLRTATYNNTTGDQGAGPKTINFTAVDFTGGLTGTATSQIAIAVSNSTVAGRFTFYAFSSRYDQPGGTAGRPPSIPFSDDNAIATDKSAYVPTPGVTNASATRATMSNITSYDQGINGIMVDLGPTAGSHSSITQANITNDFTFRIGNNNSPASPWATNTDLPNTVTVRSGAGVGGSDRVELIWGAPNGITEKWLEVIVKATGNTGLAANDTFFFGNEIGDTGASNSATVAQVSGPDVTATQTHGATLKANIPATNVYDFNKNGVVDGADVTIAQTHGTTTKTGLQLLQLGALSGPFAPAPDSSSSDTSSGTTSSGSAALDSALSSTSSSSTSSSTSTSGSTSAPALPGWVVDRLRQLDLNHGPIATFLEHLADEGTARSQEILVKADEVADALNLDDALLDSILVRLNLE